MNEPIRQSYLHVLKRNCKAANRTVFLTRLVYFGEYYCTHELLQEIYTKIINDLSTEYKNAGITGLLLVYPQHFIHVLEASEEMIYRHFKVIYSNKEFYEQLGTVIPLPPYHHVNQPFFVAWFTVFTKPPTLLDKLEASGLIEIEKEVVHLLSKVYALCEYIMDNGHDAKATKGVLSVLRESVPQFLPECTLLEFLLKVQTSVLKDVQHYLKHYMTVPLIDFYNDKIWPPTCDFVPYDVFIDRPPRMDLMPVHQSQQQEAQRRK